MDEGKEDKKDEKRLGFEEGNRKLDGLKEKTKRPRRGKEDVVASQDENQDKRKGKEGDERPKRRKEKTGKRNGERKREEVEEDEYHLPVPSPQTQTRCLIPPDMDISPLKNQLLIVWKNLPININ